MQTFKLNSCQLSTLGQLPFSLPSSVERLDLSYNALSTFILSFPLPSNLEYLSLDHNPNLIDLNFGHTRMQQRLIGLSLRSNKKIRLTSFPPHLTQLDLTDCNLSQSFLSTLLISLTKLTHLSLANNQLERLPSLDERKLRLEYLNLSNNHLTSIENKWLHPQLNTLDLQFNRIRSLEFLINNEKTAGHDHGDDDDDDDDDDHRHRHDQQPSVSTS
jgi:Leucine-rich repeat (LRR) protein